MLKHLKTNLAHALAWNRVPERLGEHRDALGHVETLVGCQTLKYRRLEVGSMISVICAVKFHANTVDMLEVTLR